MIRSKFLQMGTTTNVFNLSPRNASTSSLCKRLQGKVAIVTASTDGIGYAIAERLGEEGASVVISSRKEGNVNKAIESLRKKGITAEGVVCHVGNAEHRKQLFDVANKKFGGLDILVSNAAVNPAVSPILEVLTAIRVIAVGSYQRGTGQDYLLALGQTTVSKFLRQFLEVFLQKFYRRWIQFPATHRGRQLVAEGYENKYRFPNILGCIDCTHIAISTPYLHPESYLNHHGFHSLNVQLTDDAAWDKIFEINVKTSWQLAKEAYPEFQKRGKGNIVFISSIAGYLPMAPLGAYSVSKTTLLGLTKAIAKEVVQDNIRVNCVAPGIIATKFASAITSSEAAKESSLSSVPMNRFGKTNEIASTVAFLVSDDASYITGETIVAAGGAPAHL